MDLNEFSTPWFSLLQRYRKGKRIDKKDVLALLSGDAPVIDEAKPFIAAVIEGTYKFIPGIKPRLAEEEVLTIHHLIFDMVEAAEEEIKEEIKAGKILKKGESTRINAKRKVAEQLSMSTRTLERILKEVGEYRRMDISSLEPIKKGIPPD